MNILDELDNEHEQFFIPPPIEFQDTESENSSTRKKNSETTILETELFENQPSFRSCISNVLSNNKDHLKQEPSNKENSISNQTSCREQNIYGNVQTKNRLLRNNVTTQNSVAMHNHLINENILNQSTHTSPMNQNFLQENESLNKMNIDPPNLSLYKQDINMESEEFFEHLNKPSSSMNTSTPRSKRLERLMDTSDFGLSPVQKVYNPIETQIESKYSPLTVSISKLASQKSVSLPSSHKQKSILNYVKPSTVNENLPSPVSLNKKPCVACSRLKKNELIRISALTNKKLVVYSNTYTSSVTHMVVCIDDKNYVKDHTIKYVLAVAAGVWVINFNWVEECLKQNRLVPEVKLTYQYLVLLTY